jgi:hypothetical protein
LRYFSVLKKYFWTFQLFRLILSAAGNAEKQAEFVGISGRNAFPNFVIAQAGDLTSREAGSAVKAWRMAFRGAIDLRRALSMTDRMSAY